MDANDYQIGGNHYKIEYEHWDFVVDIKCPYLPAIALKYVSRWRDKGRPIEDLRKALHYLQKTIERGSYPSAERHNFYGFVGKFIKQFCDEDQTLMMHILEGRNEEAAKIIDTLIITLEQEGEPDGRYVNQG